MKKAKKVRTAAQRSTAAKKAWAERRASTAYKTFVAVEQAPKQDTKTLLSERGRTHGSFADHARISQSLKAVMQMDDRYTLLTAEQAEALEMIVHKIGRIIAGDASFNDHWDDIAGYAELCSK